MFDARSDGVREKQRPWQRQLPGVQKGHQPQECEGGHPDQLPQEECFQGKRKAGAQQMSRTVHGVLAGPVLLMIGLRRGKGNKHAMRRYPGAFYSLENIRYFLLEMQRGHASCDLQFWLLKIRVCPALTIFRTGDAAFSS